MIHFTTSSFLWLQYGAGYHVGYMDGGGKGYGNEFGTGFGDGSGNSVQELNANPSGYGGIYFDLTSDLATLTILNLNQHDPS